MTEEKEPEKPHEDRVDWFLCDIFDVKITVGTPELEMMISQAVQYFKAGRPLEWERWSLLSPVSRLAFSEAAARLKIEGVFQK